MRGKPYTTVEIGQKFLRVYEASNNGPLVQKIDMPLNKQTSVLRDYDNESLMVISPYAEENVTVTFHLTGKFIDENGVDLGLTDFISLAALIESERQAA